MQKPLLIFSNPKLLPKIKSREVKASVRFPSYLDRYNIKPHSLCFLVFKKRGKFVRMGIIRIKKVIAKKIFQLDTFDAKICGYESRKKLIQALKRYGRFLDPRTFNNLIVYVIHFDYVGEFLTLDMVR